MRTEGVPNFIAASLILLIVVKFNRSPSTKLDFTPYSFTISTVFFASSMLLPPVCIKILKPCSASFFAVALPIFFAPPVITATLFSLNSLLIFFSRECSSYILPKWS